MSLCKATFEDCTYVVGPAHVPGNIVVFLDDSVKVCNGIGKINDAMCLVVKVAEILCSLCELLRVY